MAKPILLVQGDTRPALVVTLTDQPTGQAINITGATLRLKFRQVGAQTLAATLDGVVLDGVVGLCKFDWTVEALSGEPGDYEGEIEITFADGKVQTVYDLLYFYLRQEF